MPIEEKEKIAKSININGNYLIDKACITNPAKIREDFYDVEKWKIFYQKNLKP